MIRTIRILEKYLVHSSHTRMDLLMKQILPLLGGAVIPPFLLVLSQYSPYTIQQPIPTPTIIPSPTPTTTPTPEPTPTTTPLPTKIPTPTNIPTPTPLPITSQQLDDWFTQFSKEYSVDRQRLWNIAVCESRLNPRATNGDYGGLYQFSSSTWRSTRQRMNLDTNPELRFNPEEAIKSAAFLLSTRGHSPWPSCSE